MIVDTIEQQRGEASNEHKPCRQCGRDLPLDSYKKYPPRGTGKYKTTTGHYTICKDCELISSRVSLLERKQKTSELSNYDCEVKQALVEHYTALMEQGFPPVTAAAKRLLGVQDPNGPKRSVDNIKQLLVEVRSGGTNG